MLESKALPNNHIIKQYHIIKFNVRDESFLDRVEPQLTAFQLTVSSDYPTICYTLPVLLVYSILDTIGLFPSESHSSVDILLYLWSDKNKVNLTLRCPVYQC